MGTYLNPDISGFKINIKSPGYVDKSGLIEHTNRFVDTTGRYICVSRPRRFGKTMAAEMLIAYYGCEHDTKSLFKELEISRCESFVEHINKYNVLFLNMQDFLSNADKPEELSAIVKREILYDLSDSFGELIDEKRLFNVNLEKVYKKTGKRFVIIVDEWDCLFRERKNDENAQKAYLDFLREFFKDKPYIALVYMTGILPIKKYGTHSPLNMFDEYSMTEMGDFAPYTGFTTEEVRKLADKASMNFDELERWYNGYVIEGRHIYNPKSVTDAVLKKRIANYWTKTDTYEALSIYFDLNINGLRDAIIEMLSGASLKIDISTFKNDMTSLENRDDVLVLLVHLGYLSYNSEKQEVYIPNEEIRSEFVTAVKSTKWDEVVMQ